MSSVIVCVRVVPRRNFDRSFDIILRESSPGSTRGCRNNNQQHMFTLDSLLHDTLFSNYFTTINKAQKSLKIHFTISQKTHFTKRRFDPRFYEKHGCHNLSVVPLSIHVTTRRFLVLFLNGCLLEKVLTSSMYYQSGSQCNPVGISGWNQSTHSNVLRGPQRAQKRLVALSYPAPGAVRVILVTDVIFQHGNEALTRKWRLLTHFSTKMHKNHRDCKIQ